MGPREKLYFCIIKEIEKIPKNKFILGSNRLSDIDNVLDEMLKNVKNDTNESINEIEEAFTEMDRFHKHYLNATIERGSWLLPPDGNLISIDGREFVYNLKNNSDKEVNGININSINANNANIGNNNNNSYWNIGMDSRINQLYKCKSKMTNENDKKTLKDLCGILKKN